MNSIAPILIAFSKLQLPYKQVINSTIKKISVVAINRHEIPFMTLLKWDSLLFITTKLKLRNLNLISFLYYILKEVWSCYLLL